MGMDSVLFVGMLGSFDDELRSGLGLGSENVLRMGFESGVRSRFGLASGWC